ncbi:MAG: CRTAC1 family protein [Acidobacteriota bacterium]|jgi:hypothetical protein
MSLAAVLVAAGAVRAAEPAPIRFDDVAEEWGLDFHHHHGGSGERYMVETVVGGVVLFDYDGDGDVDVFFVDGGELPGYTGPEPRSRLLRNDGGGRFADVTAGSGIDGPSYGAGGAAGDVDGDGDPDLYLTAFGENRLYVNRGDGTFVDRTEAAGVGDPSWSSSATFFDPDRDGDLDLYVVNYVDFTLDTHKFCGDEQANIQGYCHPEAYDGIPDRFYRNRGDGTFEDATRQAGLAASDGAGLGVVAGDLDDDGWPDVYVANDADPNFLFRNRGDGTFEDVSLLSGTAHSDRGRAEGGMGVDLGDADGDGLLDLVVTNFELESNTIYRNAGGGLFTDVRYAARLAEPSLHKLAFGVELTDLDHDGDLDLAVANGHILDNADMFNARSRYAQPNQILENLGNGRFREVPDHGMDAVRASRGLAAGDLDGDGDEDLVIVNSNDVAEVYRNLAGSAAGGWLLVDLRQDGSDRRAVGARVELETGDGGEGAPPRRQVREVRTASSYASQSPLTVHFGVAGAERIERLTIRWPDGARRALIDLPVRRRIVVVR